MNDKKTNQILLKVAQNSIALIQMAKEQESAKKLLQNPTNLEEFPWYIIKHSLNNFIKINDKKIDLSIKDIENSFLFTEILISKYKKNIDYFKIIKPENMVLKKHQILIENIFLPRKTIEPLMLDMVLLEKVFQPVFIGIVTIFIFKNRKNIVICLRGGKTQISSFFLIAKKYLIEKYFSLKIKILNFIKSIDKETKIDYAINASIALAILISFYKRELLYDELSYYFMHLVRLFGRYEVLTIEQIRQLITIRKILYLYTKHGHENFLRFEQMEVQKTIQDFKEIHHQQKYNELLKKYTPNPPTTNF